MDHSLWSRLPAELLPRILDKYGGREHPTATIIKAYVQRIHSQLTRMKVSATLSHTNFVSEFLRHQNHLVVNGLKCYKNLNFLYTLCQQFNKRNAASQFHVCIAVCALDDSHKCRPSHRQAYGSIFKIRTYH